MLAEDPPVLLSQSDYLTFSQLKFSKKGPHGVSLFYTPSQRSWQVNPTTGLVELVPGSGADPD